MSLYGLWHARSKEFYSFGGRVLVHDNRGELEWLFPGTPVRDVPPSIPPAQTLPMAQHLAGVVTFPLDRRDFR